MKRNVILLALGLALTLTACSDKKAPKEIIAKKPVIHMPKGVQSMQSSRQQTTVEWLGNSYQVTVERHADEQLPQVNDEQGMPYYDNVITVSVTREDGSSFYNHTFHKSDFAPVVSSDYLAHSALLGIVFDKTDGGRLLFAASVGSPDALSDEYQPLLIALDRNGAISMNKDTRRENEEEAEQ